MIKHLVSCLLLACALVTPLLAQTPAPAGASAQVAGFIVATRVRGQVSAKDSASGQSVALKENDHIKENYVVSTGADGSVILIFENGATVSVAENSELNIQKFEMDPFSGPETKLSDLTSEPTKSITHLAMSKGSIVGKVVHLNIDGGSEFTIATPVGAAGIRGTTFSLNFIPNPDGTALFQLVTSDGQVLFSATASLNGISVPTGKQIQTVVTVATTSQPGQPTTYAPTGTIASADAPAAVLAQIAQVAQTIISAELNSNITLTTTSTTTSTSNSSTSTSTSTTTSSTSSTTSAQTQTSVQPQVEQGQLNVPNQPQTTPGD